MNDRITLHRAAASSPLPSENAGSAIRTRISTRAAIELASKLLLLGALLALFTLSTPVAPHTHAAATRVQPEWGKLPLYFIANQGQMDAHVGYYVQGSDKTLYFASEGVTFALTDLTPQPPSLQGKGEEDSPPRFGEGLGERSERWIVKLDFIGANSVRPIGQNQTDAIISYFKGAPDQWRSGLPTYSTIVYRDLWEGIDLMYSGTVNRLKYEFVVQPGTDPAAIRLGYRGATVQLNDAGQLEVSTPAGGFHDDAPVAYQEVDGQRVPVAVGYSLEDAAQWGADESGADEPRSYGFRVGMYDPTLPLVIDPAVLVYAGYIGGSGYDRGYGIAVDAAGNAYVTGYTHSTDATFPVTIGPDLTHNGDADVFVAKVKADGTGLVYAGYIGGSKPDKGYGIAVDAAGNAYVTGYTNSGDGTFPVIIGPDLIYNGGYDDAFVAKVKADGTSLAYSGYIGGKSNEHGNAIAVTPSGTAYVTGYTNSSQATFPVTLGPDLTYNGNGIDPDAFVAKVMADGSQLMYAGYIGGSSQDVGAGIAVDEHGYAYVTGETWSSESL
ncbi:MAG: SBBP repeat-containing protein [Chloroflexi bacterium]|nr:SBBP repeat-containing protein [Chloroflexota bacterium]